MLFKTTVSIFLKLIVRNYDEKRPRKFHTQWIKITKPLQQHQKHQHHHRQQHHHIAHIISSSYHQLKNKIGVICDKFYIKFLNIVFKKNHTHPGIRYLKILDAVAHLSGNLHVEDNDD